jgi:hypothetical protein
MDDLETARLVLNAITLDDAAHPGDISVVGDRQVPRERRAVAYRRTGHSRHRAAGDRAGRAVGLDDPVEKRPHVVVGVIGLKKIPGDNRGFWLAPE